MDDNMSGQGERAFVPPEIKRWNWGAFLLNWIWGIGNDTYIALLAFIPLVNVVMIFVLGAKGSEWAWRNRRWRDVAHFKRVQRNWAIAGVAFFGGAFALFALTVIPFMGVFGRFAEFGTAIAALNANPVATSELGAPITADFPFGITLTANGTASTQLSFSVRGSKAGGTAHVGETLRAGHRVVNRLQLEINGRDRPIDLISRPIACDQPTDPKRVKTVTLPNNGQPAFPKRVKTITLPNPGR